MLPTIVALVLWLVGVIFTIYVLEKYFPNLPALVRAAIAAMVTLAILRGLHVWLCGWLCTP